MLYEETSLSNVDFEQLINDIILIIDDIDNPTYLKVKIAKDLIHNKYGLGLLEKCCDILSRLNPKIKRLFEYKEFNYFPYHIIPNKNIITNNYV
jgi:hypothetical protein